MEKFRFRFTYAEKEFEGECRQVQLDGSTDMYCTPMDQALLQKFGTKILTYDQTGKVIARSPLTPTERAYLVAVGEGLVQYLNNIAPGID